MMALLQTRRRVTRDSSVNTVLTSLIAMAGLLLLAACTPTVAVTAPEPITININMKIDHNIRVKVDKELDDLFSDDSDLF